MEGKPSSYTLPKEHVMYAHLQMSGQLPAAHQPPEETLVHGKPVASPRHCLKIRVMGLRLETHADGP